MLNTQRRGMVAGHLSDGELRALEEAVQQAQQTQRPMLVATHHPLMPVGCEWLDEIGAENGAEALSRLAPLTDRALVISGHASGFDPSLPRRTMPDDTLYLRTIRAALGGIQG